MSEKKQRQRIAKKQDVDVLFQTPKVKVIIPKSPDAVAAYASHTKWCVNTSGMTFMETYNYYMARGPLYMIIFKNDEKYCFHFGTYQFKDVLNDQVKLEFFLTEHPEIKTALRNVALEHGVIPFFEWEDLIQLASNEALRNAVFDSITTFYEDNAEDIDILKFEPSTIYALLRYIPKNQVKQRIENDITFATAWNSIIYCIEQDIENTKLILSNEAIQYVMECV